MSLLRRNLLVFGAALLLATAAWAETQACSGTSLTATLARQGKLEAALAEAAATPNGEGLLWRVERAGVAPSHLFGTMHLTDPRAAQLAPPVRQALAGSKAVELELAEIADPQ